MLTLPVFQTSVYELESPVQTVGSPCVLPVLKLTSLRPVLAFPFTSFRRSERFEFATTRSLWLSALRLLSANAPFPPIFRSVEPNKHPQSTSAELKFKRFRTFTSVDASPVKVRNLLN